MPEKQRPCLDPKVTYDPVKKTACIGDYLRNHMISFINNKYRKHRFQLIAFGKNYCKKDRQGSQLLKKPGHQKDVNILRDYTDRVKCGYNNTTQSGGMGGSERNIGMEGFLYEIYNERTGKIERHWHGYLSDHKQQDARTSFANTDKFIRMMKLKGYLPRGSTLWIQSDGANKQYKCGNALQLCIWCAERYKIQTDKRAALRRRPFKSV